MVSTENCSYRGALGIYGETVTKPCPQDQMAGKASTKACLVFLNAFNSLYLLMMPIKEKQQVFGSDQGLLLKVYS